MSSDLGEMQKVYLALHSQQALVEAHIERVAERCDRYKMGTIAHAGCEMELAMWEQVAETIKANLEGKTVQPS
jgi:hypothetical protein